MLGFSLYAALNEAGEAPVTKKLGIVLDSCL